MSSAVETADPGETTDPESASRGTSGDVSDGEDTGSRGRLSIADRVIEKIASQATGEIDHTTGVPRSFLGLQVGSDERAPSVRASADGVVATVHIDMSISWPAPIREVTRQVRQRVVDRLAELAGVTQTQVDIRVGTLAAEPSQDRRVG